MSLINLDTMELKECAGPVTIEKSEKKSVTKRRPFRKETDKLITYRIYHRFKYDPKKKRRCSTGKTLVGVVWKDKPKSLGFKVLSYYLDSGIAHRGEKKASSQSIYLNKGHINLCSVQHTTEGRKFRNMTQLGGLFFKKLELEPEEEKRLKRALRDFLAFHGIKKQLPKLDQFHKFLCPVLKNPIFKDLKWPIDLTNCYQNFRKARDFNHLMRLSFGSAGRRTKKLVFQNLEKNKDLRVFRLHHFKNMVPLEDLQEVIRRDTENLCEIRFESDSHNEGKYIKFLKAFPYQQRRGLITSYFSGRHDIDDTMRMLTAEYENRRIVDGNAVPLVFPTNLTTCVALHNYIMDLRFAERRRQNAIDREAQRIADEKIVFEPNKISQFDGCEFEDFIIRVPKKKLELEEWGEKLHNCVGSYSDRLLKNYCEIFTLHKEDRPVWCGEIIYNRLNQFSTHCNKQAEPEFKKRMELFLYEKGLISELTNPPEELM